MLYNLIQNRNGKKTVVMTGDRTKVNDRLKTLRASTGKGIKGQRVSYEVIPASEGEAKYKKPAHTQWKNYNGQGPKKA